jgi:MoxR-like ATPase
MSDPNNDPQATDPQALVAEIEALGGRLGDAREAIATRIIGQEDVVSLSLAAMLSGGHALLMGLPGLGKTLLVDTLSTVMGLSANRIQFTPDLMPADILGSEVLETAADGARSFRFIEGPIFCRLLMADEINRASPRTQSALLQAMQEREVTIAGEHRPLPAPFHVLATQNPIEQEGTYPLPEAQLDRFLVQIDVPYPDRETERGILVATTGLEQGEARQVFDPDALIAAQRVVRQMPVGEAVVESILDLVRACRPEGEEAPEIVKSSVAWGPGPRAAQALMLTVRARALLDGPPCAVGRRRGGLARPGADPPHGADFRGARRGGGAVPGDRRGDLARDADRGRRLSLSALHTPDTLRSRSETLAGSLPALMADAQHLAATVLLGVHGRKRAGTGDEFWQYRPAEAGDPLRSIDWRRSARSDGHFVRQTEWQAAQSVMIGVDDAASMTFTGAPTRPVETASGADAGDGDFDPCGPWRRTRGPDPSGRAAARRAGAADAHGAGADGWA